tara:strand:+ start:613 stop:1392 length:780 start_codon:yes stop_codon:yes gene_type:complete
MLKRRVIFTLLFFEGYFVLSRNFRLQKVGDIHWIKKNYNLKNISPFIDELIVINLSKKIDVKEFSKILREISTDFFIPVTAGGGIRVVDDAQYLLRSGADKVLINNLNIENKDELKKISTKYGKQCIVCSIDFKKNHDGNYLLFDHSKKTIIENDLEVINRMDPNLFGDLYLNSVDRDGTGQGLDFDIVRKIPENWNNPIIITGGIGNSNHFYEGFLNKRINAVSTSNLFNFIGNGFKNVRHSLLNQDVNLVIWPKIDV